MNDAAPTPVPDAAPDPPPAPGAQRAVGAGAVDAVDAVDAVAVAGVAAVAAGALARGQGAMLYCCRDRSCTTVQEHCPAGILRQDELAAAAQGGDHPRFVRHGGLACTRCGNCEPYCGEALPLAQQFAALQHEVGERLDNAALTPALIAALSEALTDGLIGPQFIDRVAMIVREVHPGDA